MRILSGWNRTSLDYFKTKLFVAGILAGCLIMNAVLELTSVSETEF